MNSNQTFRQLTSFQIGGAVCLPVLLVGQELGKTYGFANALIAIIIGNTLLFFLSIAKATMAYENKQTTIENASGYFGNKGSSLLAIIMIVSLVGWFAIQLNMIALSIGSAVGLFTGLSINNMALNITLGAIITLVATKGIQALNKLADISMPVLLCTIGYAVYNAASAPSTTLVTPTNPSLGGISLVLATAIMAVVDLPTYYRFARSKKESLASLFVLFVFAIPLIEGAGAFIAQSSNKSDLLTSLSNFGGITYQLWIAMFLLLAGWTTNNANLYSATVTLKQLLPKTSHITRTLIVGGIGTIFSCFALLENLETTLSGMGVLVSAMGAVIVTNYLMDRLKAPSRPQYARNMCALLVGSAVGFGCLLGHMCLSGFELLDAFFVTTMSAIIFRTLGSK